MKRILSIILLLCLLAALLSGCAESLPSLPPLPGSSAAQTPEPTAEPTPEPTPEPPAVPEKLELGFILPSAEESDEELVYYLSPAEEFDCAFVYPSYCALWVEKGAVRLNPSWFFARMFFSSVRKDAEGAPDEMLDMLEPGKWGSVPIEGSAGTGWPSLRAMNLKYDTWREWIAWETPERYYLLYGACFDHYGREETLDAIFETIAGSFRTAAELVTAAPAEGALLRQSGGLSLYFDGAALGGGTSPRAELRLKAYNTGQESCSLAVSGYTADGVTFPFEAVLDVAAGEGQLWTLSLPLMPEEGGATFESLGFWVSAQGNDGSLFELPVRIELSK